MDAVVIGAGIVGLTAASELRATGRDVTVVTADPVAATTSNVAAAVWFPTRVGADDRVVAWGARTRIRLVEASNDPAAAVLLRDTVTLFRRPPGRPWWTAALDDVEDAPADLLPAGYDHGLRFTVPLAEMPRHLAWLADRLGASGVPIVERRVASLHEAAEIAPIVVDAAGLGARELAHDPTVTPVRGQVVRTSNPGLTTSYRDQDHPEGYTYVHPRTHDVIVGGTVEDDRTDLEPDPDTAAAILARGRALVPALAHAEVLGHAVGLRPARPTVRLELDTTSVPGATVVHDYGHGGAGMTLGWGCAEEVVRLLDA